MRRVKSLILLAMLALLPLACTLCEDIPSGSNAAFERILGCNDFSSSDTENVSTYPVTYTGAATLKTSNVCDSQASAAFTAYDDGTCVLTISFPLAYQNFEGLMPGDAGYGECKTKVDDLLGWTIYGEFDKKQQVCKFSYCNDKSYYSAKGHMTFSALQADLTQTVMCTSKESGEKQIEITDSSLVR